ncbi:MAG: sigma-54 dependent transcriptional regulator [Gemmatimonadota bacterium]
MVDPEPSGARATILLVDDQPANLAVLRQLLESQGYRVVLAPTGAVALRNAARIAPDLVLLDVMMPEMDGFEVCRRLKADPATEPVPVVFITAREGKEDLLAGFAAGGLDYITKPIQEEEVLARSGTHVRLYRAGLQLQQQKEELERQIARGDRLSTRLSVLAERDRQRWGLEDFVGQSTTVRRLVEEVRLTQENAAVPVLLVGESGTGKELLARAVHIGSPRRDEPFVPVNCAALPGELAESLLFGHLKGAFTGAETAREGYFEVAHGGTLFLDEIGEMPFAIQAKLLRVLEDGQVWRVGARESRPVDVRVMAATNADLQARIARGAFRQDLYFHLARFTVEVPPLRQRRDDIPLLARHFHRLYAAEIGPEAPPLNAEVIARLQAYPFPGNVRELKNIVERALIESRGHEIRPWHLHFLPPNSTAAATSPTHPSVPDLPLDIDAAVRQAERQVVQRALDLCDGNLTAAARMLGSNRNRLYRILGEPEPEIGSQVQ